jgi:NAD(P) transhydrogenase
LHKVAVNIFLLKGGLDFFLSNVFNYPTYAECYRVAALNAYNNMRAEAGT